LQPPKLQPAKLEPAVGVAVKLTWPIPFGNGKLHPWFEPDVQSMPAGVLTTRPVPSPMRLTVNVVTLACVNAALTLTGPSSESVHGPLPEQGPFVHPPKVDVFDGAAVSVTVVPVANVAEHGVLPPAFEQLMPAGALVTVPCPLPTSCTESCCVPLPLPPLPPLPPVVDPEPPPLVLVEAPVVTVLVGVPLVVLPLSEL
jgi:hypothetical protein